MLPLLCFSRVLFVLFLASFYYYLSSPMDISKTRRRNNPLISLDGYQSNKSTRKKMIFVSFTMWYDMQFLSAKSPPIDLRRERYDIGDEQIRRKSSSWKALDGSVLFIELLPFIRIASGDLKMFCLAHFSLSSSPFDSPFLSSSSSSSSSSSRD